MTVPEDARAAARRIVEEVLADHAARSATPAAPTRVERPSPVPPPPQATATPITATNHPDTPAWRTARRIVDEVLASHASTPASPPSGGTLVAAPANVVADETTPIDSLDVPTLVIDVSDAATEVAVVSESAPPVPADGIPEELFAGHIVVSEADGDEATAAVPTVEPPVEPDVDPVPVDPDPMPVDPDPMPVDPDPIPVNPDPMPVDPDPVPVDPDPVPVDPDPLEPQPGPIDSDAGTPPKPQSMTSGPTSRTVSTEAATIASRIVAEVLADHAERESAAAVAQEHAAGTTAQLPTATHEIDVPTGDAPETTHEMAVAPEEPEPTQEAPAHHKAQQPDGPPPIPDAAGPTLPADPAPDVAMALPARDTSTLPHGSGVDTGTHATAEAAVGTVLTDAPPPLAEEVETRDQTKDLDEVQGPRRTGRWLMTTIVGAVALAFLFPLAVRALRELISLG